MNNKGFFGLIGLLFAIAVISCCAYFVFVKYFGKPTGMDQSTQEAAQQSGIDTSSQTSIYDSAKSKIRGIDEAEQAQSQQLANALGQ